MKLILDERETNLFEKCSQIQNGLASDGSSNKNITTLSKRVLHLGDALITTDDDKDILLLERKSLADLLASIKDGRYEEQSYRLMHADGVPQPHHIIYIVEGIISQLRSAGEKKMVYSAMTSLNVFKGFSVIRTSGVQETAEWILALTDKVGRELAQGKSVWTARSLSNLSYQSPDNVTNAIVHDADNGETNNQDTDNSERRDLNNAQNNIIEGRDLNNAQNNIIEGRDLKSVKQSVGSLTVGTPYCSVVKQVKKENVTPENMGQIILCQIPGISSKSAIAIMQQFTSLSHLMRELESNPNCLAEIKCENNGKFRKLSKTIVENLRTYLLREPTVPL